MTVELTSTHQRFMTLAQAKPDLRPPNITSVFELFGDLDPAMIEAALHDATARHQLLHICYSNDGTALEPGKRTHDPLSHRATVCDEATVLQEVARIAHEQDQKVFAARECPLMVVTLLSVNRARWFLILTVDHMVADGLSIGMLIREMSFAYLGKKRGRELPLPKVLGSYAEHVKAEADLLRREGPERRAWWERELRDYVPPHSASPPAAGPIGAVKATIPAAVFGDLVANAKKAEVGVSAVVLHAYAKAVMEAGVGDDILINKIISSRTESMRAVLGDFIDLVPVRIKARDLDAPAAVRNLARSIESAADRRLPYWTLTEWLYPQFFLHPYGICNVWFNYFPPHSRRLVAAKELGVELFLDATPPPRWAPCSVCVNVQPMIGGDTEVVVLSNTSDVADSGRQSILRGLVDAIEHSSRTLPN